MVAFEAAKNQLTQTELSQNYEVCGVMISRWKREFLDNLEATFDAKYSDQEGEEQVNVEKHYAQIGQLKVENDPPAGGLQETGDMSQRVQLVTQGAPKLSVPKQCDLLVVNRNRLCYRNKPESEMNMDKTVKGTPFRRFNYRRRYEGGLSDFSSSPHHTSRK